MLRKIEHKIVSPRTTTKLMATSTTMTVDTVSEGEEVNVRTNDHNTLYRRNHVITHSSTKTTTAAAAASILPSGPDSFTNLI